jgi:DNA-binding transcriptional MerR regulator
MQRADFSSGDLARATGHTVRTVRHYEEAGLLVPSEVSDGGHRRYTEDDLERLRLIVDLREVGLSLCEIKSILSCGPAPHAASSPPGSVVIEVHLSGATKARALRRMRRRSGLAHPGGGAARGAGGGARAPRQGGAAVWCPAGRRGCAEPALAAVSANPS